MRGSCSQQQQKKDLSAYDFNADELAVEEAAASRTSRLLQSSKSKSNPNPKEEERDKDVKYKFLQAFSGSDCKRMDVNDISCIDLHENGSAQGSSGVDSPERNMATTDDKSEFDENRISSTSDLKQENSCLTKFDSEGFVRTDSFMTGSTSLIVPSFGDEHVSNLQSDGTSVDVISDDEESCRSESESASTASYHVDDEDYLERPISDIYFSAFGEKDKDDLAVIITPDYVIHKNTLYGEARLLFFSDSIIVKCSDVNGNNENFVLECSVDDIICIQCRWSVSVESALIKFYLRATSVNGNEQIHDSCVKLICAVSDMRWLEKEMKIKSLAERYKDIWNASHNDQSALEDDDMECKIFFPRHYFIEIPDSFEDVIYPKGDPDAVAISKRDIELLQPDTFINDTIIDFYVKYLKTRIPHNERHRFHFFNSFFFRKLADLDKDPGSASEGRAAFLRVRKWTRKVNIFEKDYIFIPVNFNLHWSLLVVCHPGEVSILEEEDIKDSPKVPCILHMDSIKGSHSGLKNLVQSYLMEEWKERHPDSVDDHTSKFSNMRFVSLELPQQENSFDCGLFLLHYVELFLEEAPINFNPFKINKFNSFLTMDWFIPSEASFKRSLIRKLIYDLLNDPSQNVPPTSNVVISSGYHDSNTEQRPGLEFFNKHYDTSKTYVGNSTCSLTVSGIEMNLETLPSPGVAQCDKQGRRVMHEFLEPRTSSMSLFQEDASFQMPKCATSSNKEHADKSKQFSTSNLDRETHCPVGENSTSYRLKDVGEPETPWNSMQEKEEIGLSLLPKSCNVTVSNLSGEIQERSGEIQERTVSVEGCGYVSDSPPSSSGENRDGGTDCSQEINASKTVGGETYEISQEIETATETEGDDIKHEEVNIAEAKDYGEDGEKNDSHETDTNKAEAFVSEEFQSVVDTTNVVDCVKDEDIQRNDNHNDEESFPPQNSKNVAVADEISLARDGRQLKRGGPSSRIEIFYQKRRKVVRPDGERRCTRSLSRDSTTS